MTFNFKTSLKTLLIKDLYNLIRICNSNNNKVKTIFNSLLIKDLYNLMKILNNNNNNNLTISKQTILMV